MLRAALLLLVAVSLSACGSEAELPDPQPAEPRPAELARPAVPAVREVCTVQLLDDGQVACVCVRVQ